MLLIVNSICGRTVYYLSFATYFCVKMLKIAISVDIVIRKQPLYVQGHPRLLILVPMERAYMYTFLVVINSNFSPILHRFGDMAA